ncbi:alpha-2-macroglobulin family protein [Luteolibacter sp. AS25]|uniref:alpha-2-macroglobulin family protein n=1 Tax=Luteolibacter sp. AS25 TaxID=3135776 RepID=UPI00398AC23B
MKILILFLLSFLTVMAEDAANLRGQAEKLEQEGNWREAYELRVKLLRESDDERSGEDLSSAVQSLNNLGEQEEFDPLLAEITELKKGNPDLMLAAGHAYLYANHYGRLLDNKFQRGSNGRGDYRNVMEQDRVRAIQCFFQAWEAAAKGGAEEVAALGRLGDALRFSRIDRQFLWKFYELTDLSAELDYTEQIDQISSEGAPVDQDGEPSWIDIPESWDLAASDAERWRWLTRKISEIEAQSGLQEEYEWLSFCQNNYGVETLAGYSWWGKPDADERDGMLSATTLEETETIARLANGVKRFKLREDYQFIPGFRKMMRAGKGPIPAAAGDSLVQVFLHRNQNVAAVEALKEVIELHGDPSGEPRAALLKQIRGNWSQFGATPTYYAEEDVEVPYNFRNADGAVFSLFRVDEEQVMRDTMEYLEGNPITIDYEKINFSDLGSRLISEKPGGYVKEKLRDWVEKLTPKEAHQNDWTSVNLGKLQPGCYLLKSSMDGGNTSWIVLRVRDLVLLKRGEGPKQVFYLVDATSGQPVAGELEFFGYRTEHLEKRKILRRYNVETYHFTRKTDEKGRLELKEEVDLWDRSQWRVIARAGDRRTYFSDKRLHWGSLQGSGLYRTEKTLGITDRPVYRPGQKVHLKLWAGEARYDLEEVSKFAGAYANVEIFDGRNEVVFDEKNLTADEYGGITFDLELKEDAALGSYRVSVTGSVPDTSFFFRVEEYKKPEFEVTVDAPDKPVALGEKFEATVSANYYHGAPVTEATVKIKVERNFFNDRWFPAGEWDWLYGAGYWWAYGEYSWYPGWLRWGCIRPAPPWWQGGRSGAPELILEQTSAIGPDGKVKVEIDSSIAKLIHGDHDHSYSITAEVVDASRRTIVGSGSVLASREPFSITTWLDRGYASIGDTVTGTFSARTLDGKEVKGMAKAVLYRSTIGEDGEVEEEKIGEWTPEGRDWSFVASKAGQYRISVDFTDENGRKQEGATVFSVRGAEGEIEGDFRTNALEIIPDKKEYRPGDTLKLLVNVNQPGSRVWLFIRPSQGEVSETRILEIEGKSEVVEIPLTLRDMPNLFIEAVSVSKGEVVTVTREIVLPPEKRKLNVEVQPAKDKLKPGEKTKFTVRISDADGKPYKGSVAISVYDKSLEYISGGSNIGEIVPFFWDWKRHYYSRGIEDSQGLVGRHLQLRNSTLMQWLGLSGSRGDFGGGLALAGGVFKRDGAMNLPAPMMATAGADRFDEGSSMDMPPNARAEKKEKGDIPEVVVRSEFVDLLKWVGSVETDESGEATIDLEMPDNLTTWKIKTWAMGHGTKVGEGSAEIVTSKDLIVRLQAPRFFVEKDEVTLSAVVHNYHDEAKDVLVGLELDGKNLEVANGTPERRVAIPAGGETRIDWNAIVKKEGEVTIRMKAITADDSDAMEMSFPVYVHGIAKTESFSAAISPEDESTKIDFSIPGERRPSESKLVLNYSPSVASALVDALPYLANYPYVCTEQTLNRFVPTTVLHSLLKNLGHDLAAIKDKRINLNPQQLGDAKERAKGWRPDHPEWNPVWDEDEVAKMERAGIAKLLEQQNPDGGWGWFSAYGNDSYPHTTAVVMHGLLLAKENGAKIPDDMINRGLEWLTAYESSEIRKILNYGKKNKKPSKQNSDSIDALVRRVLGEGGKNNEEMTAFLFRDKNSLPVYAKALLGLEFHRLDEIEKRDEVIRNIRQYLKRDDENQTAYLDLPNRGYWWYWYGSEFEAQAWFLKLLAAAEPKGADTRGLVKYLINNRSNTTYWNSTRDTAYCLEAIGDYLKNSGEGEPDLSVEILLDGKSLKTVEINRENLFSYDSSVIVAGDILTGGEHSIEIRKSGKGPIYANAYVEYFTLEEFITKAGLEVKVDRTFYKLVPETKDIKAVDSKGQAIDQKRAKYKRVLLKSGDEVKSGDLIEVELGIDSKNDYEYLLFEDWKAVGMEAVEVQSGYNPNGLGAYMELRDEKVSLFVQNLPRGRHNLNYRLRAEIPGKFSALPTRAEAMYAPELKANSDEMKISVSD